MFFPPVIIKFLSVHSDRILSEVFQDEENRKSEYKESVDS